MTEKTNFKLAYNGENHRFGSSYRHGVEELFTAVTEYVAKLVKERNYELYWRDDDSDVVLASATDLSTAIDYAKCTRKKPKSTPCVHLAVVVGTSAADSKAADESMLLLLKMAIEQKWTAELISLIEPLNRQNPVLPKPTEIFAAQVAVKLAELEKRVPEEIKQQLLRLPRKQQTGLAMWDGHLVPHRQELQSLGSSMFVAETAVKVAVSLAIDLTWMDYREYLGENNDDDEDEDSEDESESEDKDEAEYEDDDESESEDEYEDVEQPGDWSERQAKAITKRAEKLVDAAYEAPVYPCPAEFLRKSASAADTVIKAAVPVQDRVTKIKQYLQQLPESVPDMSRSTIPVEIERHTRLLDPHVDCDRMEIYLPSFHSRQSVVAAMLRRTVEDLPHELQLELIALRPVQLARVALMDWMDRLDEEKRTVRNLHATDFDEASLPTRCSPSTLQGLMCIAAAASMYPEQLKQKVEVAIKHLREKRNKDNMSKNLSAEQVKALRITNTNTEFAEYLEKYMSFNKAYNFIIRMLTGLARHAPACALSVQQYSAYPYTMHPHPTQNPFMQHPQFIRPPMPIVYDTTAGSTQRMHPMVPMGPPPTIHPMPGMSAYIPYTPIQSTQHMQPYTQMGACPSSIPLLPTQQQFTMPHASNQSWPTGQSYTTAQPHPQPPHVMGFRGMPLAPQQTRQAGDAPCAIPMLPIALHSSVQPTPVTVQQLQQAADDHVAKDIEMLKRTLEAMGRLLESHVSFTPQKFEELEKKIDEFKQEMNDEAKKNYLHFKAREDEMEEKLMKIHEKVDAIDYEIL